MIGDKVTFRLHALQRMFQRRISTDEVKHVLQTGEAIEQYPDDTPYPSCLILGRTQAGRPLHVVAAYNATEDETIIVTVYEPDPQQWDETVRKRL